MSYAAGPQELAAAGTTAHSSEDPQHRTWEWVRVRHSGWAWGCPASFDSPTLLGVQHEAHCGEKLHDGKEDVWPREAQRPAPGSN